MEEINWRLRCLERYHDRLTLHLSRLEAFLDDQRTNVRSTLAEVESIRWTLAMSRCRNASAVPTEEERSLETNSEGVATSSEDGPSTSSEPQLYLSLGATGWRSFVYGEGQTRSREGEEEGSSIVGSLQPAGCSREVNILGRNQAVDSKMSWEECLRDFPVMPKNRGVEKRRQEEEHQRKEAEERMQAESGFDVQGREDEEKKGKEEEEVSSMEDNMAEEKEDDQRREEDHPPVQRERRDPIVTILENMQEPVEVPVLQSDEMEDATNFVYAVIDYLEILQCDLCSDLDGRLSLYMRKALVTNIQTNFESLRASLFQDLRRCYSLFKYNIFMLHPLSKAYCLIFDIRSSIALKVRVCELLEIDDIERRREHQMWKSKVVQESLQAAFAPPPPPEDEDDEVRLRRLLEVTTPHITESTITVEEVQKSPGRLSRMWRWIRRLLRKRGRGPAAS